jgi:hypothetical protein
MEHLEISFSKKSSGETALVTTKKITNISAFSNKTECVDPQQLASWMKIVLDKK